MLYSAPIPPEAAVAQRLCDLIDGCIDRQPGGLNDAFLINGCVPDAALEPFSRLCLSRRWSWSAE